ncbi:MAG TPA: MFS transporter [Polyangiaceae bacterium]|nr:MFS transporter [Polyangiaceae bacterium]
MKKWGLLSALYLAQGLPYGFFTQALPVLLREAGHSLKAISALSFLYLPWALKFLWAPYLDRATNRRAWLLSFQLSGVLAALLLSRLDLRGVPAVILSAAFAFNVIAASQDVVTDGLAIRLLGPSERGLANAIQVGAYRIGMILGGGLLLWIYAKTSWSIMFGWMAALLALTVFPVWQFREPSSPRPEPAPRGGLPGTAWLERVKAPGMLSFAALLFVYRFGDAMVSNVLGPFLKDSGLTKQDIALMKGTIGSATSVLGAVLGGWFVFRVERRTALLAAGLAQAATFTLYVAAATGWGGSGLLWFATVCEGVLGTVATVALFTLMMDASEPEHAGADYTLLASFVILVNSLGTFCSAAIVDAWGYVPAFVTGTVLAAAGCVALVVALDRRATPARLASVWRREKAV